MDELNMDCQDVEKFSNKVCICSSCGKHGWEGCPRGDAEEEVMDLKRRMNEEELKKIIYEQRDNSDVHGRIYIYVDDVARAIKQWWEGK